MFKDVLLQSRMLLLRQDFLEEYEFECGIKRGKTLIENKNA
jgi:hypothetical protein